MNERVKELRKALGISLEKFAAPLGVGKSAISKIECETVSVTDQMISAICRAYKVREEWLRTGAGEMFVEDAENELSILAERYNLSEDAKTLVRQFIVLPPDKQEAIIEFVRKASAALEGDLSELEESGIAAAEAAYEEAFGIRLKRASPVSSTTEDTGT